MTTKKPPPPSYRPTAGFASVTEAVRHFAKEGKSPKEIAELTGSTTEAVRGLMQRHRQVRRTTAIDGLTWPQRDKIRRTYMAYLDLMAEGLGSDRDVVHHLCRGVHVNKEPALPPEQKGGGIEPGERADPAVTTSNPNVSGQPLQNLQQLVTTPETVIPASEPPVIVAKPKNTTTYDELTGAAQVTLRATNGEWLRMDGGGTTRIKAYRYLGTPAQAKKMRLASKFATGMRIESASPSKGHSK